MSTPIYIKPNTALHSVVRPFLVAALFVLSGFVVTSCTEKIDIPLEDSFIRLVVDGAITTDTMAHKIKITTTSSYYLNQAAPPVRNATVIITDGNNVYPLTESAPGIYETAHNVFGIPGHTYTLTIRLSEAVGGYLEYTAISLLNREARVDSIGLMFRPDWGRKGVWEVKCYVQEPPTVDFYRFLVSKNSNLISDSLHEWFVTDDVLFNGSYTNGATVSYLSQGNPGEGIRPGDTIWLEVDNIGKDYCNFIWQVQAEVRGSNPLFSGPPSNVKGNVSNGGVGFFAAYDLSRSYAIAPEFKQ